MRATDGMSGQMPLHKQRSGWGRKQKLPTFLPSARNERVPRANLRAFISPLMGGRMVANGVSAPIGGRSEDACPCESELQAEVAGLTAEWSVPTPRQRRGGGESGNVAVKESLQPQAQTYAPATATKERWRDKAEGKTEGAIYRPGNRSGF